jgi:hypothetical protein
VPTECNATLFEFAPVEGRQVVVAAFDGGTITSDADASLLGETDRAIQLTDRFASCLIDTPMAELVSTPRWFWNGWLASRQAMKTSTIAMNSRHDPVLAVLAGKLAAKRTDCAPLAGKSTLHRLELSRPAPTRYHKASHDAAAIEEIARIR